MEDYLYQNYGKDLYRLTIPLSNDYSQQIKPLELSEINTPSTESPKDSLNSASIENGVFSGNFQLISGALQSANFVTGSAGWRITSAGNFEGSSGTFRGTITATTGAIGGFDIGSDYIRDIANSMGMASTVTGGDDVRFWAGDTYTNRATAPFRVTEAGAIFGNNVTIGGASIQYVITNNGIFSFGDGSDGAAVFNGTDAVTGASLAGSTYTLTRDVYYTDATISTGVTLKPDGYRIFGTGTLTLNGTATIKRNGNNGTNASEGTQGTGGAALADGYLKGSAAGKDGATGSAVAGTAGATTANSIGTAGSAGGAGGAGASAGGAGGAGGTWTTSNVKLIANWHLATLLDISSTGSTVKFDNSSGAGSGGSGQNGTGNGNPTGAGGGSGSAGGIIAIYFRVIVIGASASIVANGGNGGNGGVGANGGANGGNGGGGGGGGGNGGQVILVYNSITNNGSITENGGTGGTGGAGGSGTPAGSAGSSGTNGTAGSTRQFLVSL